MKALLKLLYCGIGMILICSMPVIAMVGAMMMFIEMLSATGFLAVCCFLLFIIFALFAIVCIIGIGLIVEEPLNNMKNEEELK